MATTALSTVLTIVGQLPTAAMAQQKPAAEAVQEEIVVTGSRIVREGYEAPTPLTVVSAEQLQNSATPGLIGFLNDMPALAGNVTGSSSNTSTFTGGSGAPSVNLRGLGTSRTLVLLDGRRLVGLDYNGVVNVSTIPQQLIQRVDIVTGGASAIYGSDAVGGVVNFILDKNFTGVKGEVSGGMTTYKDDKNYKLNVSAGMPFGPDNRGQVLFSIEHVRNAGIPDGFSRDWNEVGYHQTSNPNYTPTNGQPNLLNLYGSALGVIAPGGLITAGPLKGTAFGEGGKPFQFNYGTLFGPTGGIAGNQYIQGGDWRMTNQVRAISAIAPKQGADNIFLRASYDLSDNINVFVQYDWGQSTSRGKVTRYWSLGALTIRSDNAYLPDSVRAAMAANGLTQFTMGSGGGDTPVFGHDNTWITNRIDAGAEGSFSISETDWRWNFAYGYGSTDQNAHSGTDKFGNHMVSSRFRESIDSVVNPATGQVVCRVALTNPATDCKPYNIIGTGVNDNNTISWLSPAYQYGLLELTSYTASISGEPFALWAGPVGVAASFEHRKDEMHAVVSADSYPVPNRPFGNQAPLDGVQSVTEGAFESVIPLARDTSWATSWELSLAARYTDYELAGSATTWKAGTTYSPSDELLIRASYSRDLRAPNFSELFAKEGGSGLGTITDPTRNNENYLITRALTAGNPNVKPEKAKTLGIGAVYSPSFIDGFTASVDYWGVKIKDAIQYVTRQQLVDLCYGSQPGLCSSIVRGADGRIFQVTVRPANFAIQDVRGLDLEASYNLPISNVVESWDGTLSVHGNMTFYLRNFKDDTFTTPQDRVGEMQNPPDRKYSVNATYTLDPIQLGVTARGFSSGILNKDFIVCTTGCPAATPANPTINSNYLPGRFYLDANVNYNWVGESAQAQLFFSVKNIFDKDPAVTPASFLPQQAGASIYDIAGRVYRAGLRFRM